MRVLCEEIKKVWFLPQTLAFFVLLLTVNLILVRNDAMGLRNERRIREMTETSQGEEELEGTYATFRNNIRIFPDRVLLIGGGTDEDSYEYRNAVKTREAFQNLSVRPLKADSEEGVEGVADARYTDWIVMAMAMYFALSLITKERSGGQLLLTSVTVRGGRMHAFAKCTAIVVNSALTAVVLYGMNLLVFGRILGFGDPEREIQSVSRYISCPFPLSVSGFLLVSFLGKIFSVCAVASFLFLLTAVFRSAVFTSIAAAVLLSVEGLAFYKIAPQSRFGALHDWNLFTAFDVHRLVGVYRNCSVFGYPLSLRTIGLIIGIICLFGCGVAGILVYEYRCLAAKRPDRGRRRVFGRHSSAFLHECHKALIGGRALLILAIYSVIAWNVTKADAEYFEAASDLPYKQYMISLSGRITPEKERFLDAEKEELDRLQEQMMQDYAAASTEEEYRLLSVKWDYLKNRREAFSKLSKHTDYLRGTGGWYVYDTGFRIAFGRIPWMDRNRMYAVLTAIFLVLACAYTASCEHQFGTWRLIAATRTGKERVFLHKSFLCAGVALIMQAGLYTAAYVRLFHVYGWNGLWAPLCSIEGYAGWTVPIGAYLMFRMLVLFAFLLAVTQMLLWLGKRTKNYSLTVLIGILLAGGGAFLLF